MGNDVFAVERYDESGSALPPDPLPELPPGARLTCALHLRADDVLLAVVEGADEQAVRAALKQAGWRFDRITAGAWITPPAAAK